MSAHERAVMAAAECAVGLPGHLLQYAASWGLVFGSWMDAKATWGADSVRPGTVGGQVTMHLRQIHGPARMSQCTVCQ